MAWLGEQVLTRGLPITIHGVDTFDGWTGTLRGKELRAAFDGYTGGGDKERVRGLMSTGDLGHFDSAGRLFIDGRDDEMIVSGGENVFPAEVEDLISGHPEVIEATAIGVDDKDFGQRLRAFVVLKQGAQLTEDAIKDYVRDHLARYKVPREVIFLAELPRNPTGKILKRELRQIEIR
jgi:fatty-acyl-CoA synthase